MLHHLVQINIEEPMIGQCTINPNYVVKFYLESPSPRWCSLCIPKQIPLGCKSSNPPSCPLLTPRFLKSRR